MAQEYRFYSFAKRIVFSLAVVSVISGFFFLKVGDAMAALTLAECQAMFGPSSQCKTESEITSVWNTSLFPSEFNTGRECQSQGGVATFCVSHVYDNASGSDKCENQVGYGGRHAVCQPPSSSLSCTSSPGEEYAPAGVCRPSGSISNANQVCCIPVAPKGSTGNDPGAVGSSGKSAGNDPGAVATIGDNVQSIPQSVSFGNPLQYNTVQDVLGSLLSTLQNIIVILSIIFIVIGAVLYITSAGDSKKVESAKSAITASMIGLALGIAAPSFLKEISGILGWNAAPANVGGAISLTQILTNVLSFLTGIVGILSIIMLVIGALMMLTAAGNENQIDSGKKVVKYSVVGIIVAFAALVIVRQVAALFVV